MYKITLADGTVLDNLELNGNNFISDTLIDDSVFIGNLTSVTIEGDESKETHTNMKLTANRVMAGKQWFILSDKSEDELWRDSIEAALCDIDQSEED